MKSDLKNLLHLMLQDDEDDEELLKISMQIDEFVLLGQQQHSNPNQGSVRGHRVINRDRLHGHNQLMKDYFSETSDPTFDSKFRRRFRMRRDLFIRILEGVEGHDRYFVQKRDAAGRLGLSAHQKVVSAFRQLSYGISADATDEYLRIGESTANESLKRFCKAVCEVFGQEYLRRPTRQDLDRLLAVAEKRGFPGMIGSLDCMHWKWKNCPTAWQGRFTGKEKEPTLVLEAVASYDLWIWHSFFGLPGALNDINVLDRSDLFAELASGKGPSVNFQVNGHDYDMGYYLADGIYPKYATLVQTISQPQTASKQHFAKLQEAYRKDVERAFGVLQARFAIIKQPARLWNNKDLNQVMDACIILHNMIVEDERDTNNVNHVYDEEKPFEPVDCSYDHQGCASTAEQAPKEPLDTFDEFLERFSKIKNKDIHYQLRNDLVEHLWKKAGNE